MPLSLSRTKDFLQSPSRPCQTLLDVLGTARCAAPCHNGSRALVKNLTYASSQTPSRDSPSFIVDKAGCRAQWRTASAAAWSNSCCWHRAAAPAGTSMASQAPASAAPLPLAPPMAGPRTMVMRPRAGRRLVREAALGGLGARVRSRKTHSRELVCWSTGRDACGRARWAWDRSWGWGESRPRAQATASPAQGTKPGCHG